MYLRTYEPGDLQPMFELDAICFAPPFRFSRAAMRRFAEVDYAVTRVACETAQDGTERIVGFCIVHLQPAKPGLAGYVVTLDVAPDRRGQGFARALMASAEAEARGRGARSLSLHVFTGNGPGIALYEAEGFRRVGLEENFYGPEMSAWLYRKGLIAETGTGQAAEALPASGGAA